MQTLIYKFVEWVCRNNHSFTIMEEPELLLNFAPPSRKILVENYPEGFRRVDLDFVGSRNINNEEGFATNYKSARY